jgi:non-canonical (house-cleaning) NTP pyrophosphatase
LDDRLQALDDEPTDFYVALESGIIPNVFESGEAVDLSVAAIHDKRVGKSAGNTFYGVSPGFVVPKDIIEQMPPRGKSELANAFRDQYGFDAKGRSGVIGPLSLQRIRRTDFEFLAVLMALWQIVYPMGLAGPTSGRPTSESS